MLLLKNLEKYFFIQGFAKYYHKLKLQQREKQSTDMQRNNTVKLHLKKIREQFLQLQSFYHW